MELFKADDHETITIRKDDAEILRVLKENEDTLSDFIERQEE
ncbi:hypothetical protein [Jeotgalibaca sp. MA1X17-3]|nr:hypothetical protein [Jeotgalibaca sp. MA1X17-3]